MSARMIDGARPTCMESVLDLYAAVSRTTKKAKLIEAATYCRRVQCRERRVYGSD